ncbi:class I SAM-dependent methyltransferase [Paraburkholderia sp. D15]|uniref:class I SAM-dependent methyltransferase n=1 Tax=Paraburkholderia sp. D15 TaxID=2880218 RepID=UPI0024794405|nr:class I SAM-dependent methyltransferase [Paraburkholderia sp. D15]WGS54149.1 class I SAM-dependent methyltransferase [Paraburkholderia sp. D15]
MSPSLSNSTSGFRPEYFERLAEVEERNFWFRARNRLIVWAASRYMTPGAHFCEIGCGTGYVLSGLANAFPATQFSATEIYPEALTFAAGRVPRASFYQMDARHIPFVREFSVMGAFDVIEHIEEDERVLSEMHRALVPAGHVILTVPQHPFMWSQQDEQACHVRRYRAAEIRQKLQDAGFTVRLMTSFVSLLFPLMYLTRRRPRVDDADYDITADLRLGRVTNGILEGVMAVESAFIRWGLRIPFGGSLLIVAQKNS